MIHAYAGSIKFLNRNVFQMIPTLPQKHGAYSKASAGVVPKCMIPRKKF
jgi:hypothetical protein